MIFIQEGEEWRCTRVPFRCLASPGTTRTVYVEPRQLREGDDAFCWQRRVGMPHPRGGYCGGHVLLQPVALPPQATEDHKQRICN